MKTLYLLYALLFLGVAGCRSSEPEPDSATLISGDYSAVVALNTGLVYPINGKLFRLKIQRVSRDTVQVVIQSEPNHGFSPGHNLTYAKAFIEPSASPVAKQNPSGSYQYIVYLTPNVVNNSNSLNNVLLFYQYNGHTYVDYHYRPEGTNPQWEGEEITRLQRF